MPGKKATSYWLALWAILSAVCMPVAVHAQSFGTVKKTFNNISVSRLYADPYGPYVFGSETSQNSVVIFNTQTLTEVGTVFVGSNPEGMSVSPNGTTLYVADSGADSVGVVNLQTMTAQSSLSVSVQPIDIQAGNNNQLYLLGNGVIQQVSAVTGANTASSQGAGDGQIKISADRNTLVFGNTGVSPGHFSSYNLSSGTITSTGGFDFGGNDRALSLSSNASFFTFASAGSPYQIPIFNTSNFSTLGTLNLGGPPQLITLSPNNNYAYVITTYVDPIYVFNTQTFLQVGSFNGPGSPTDLVTDNTGNELFVSASNSVTVYAVPEPATLFLPVLATILILGRRARRSHS